MSIRDSITSIATADRLTMGATCPRLASGRVICSVHFIRISLRGIPPSDGYRPVAGLALNCDALDAVTTDRQGQSCVGGKFFVAAGRRIWALQGFACGTAGSDYNRRGRTTSTARSYPA